MTVEQLIERLRMLPNDLDVYVQHLQYPVKADVVISGDHEVYEDEVEYKVVPRVCVVIS